MTLTAGAAADAAASAHAEPLHAVYRPPHPLNLFRTVGVLIRGPKDPTLLVDALWQSAEDETPGERTIDVHVRRLRAKLGRYEDIVRTVRGVGYRFDRHADVSIRHASTPSPDVF